MDPLYWSLILIAAGFFVIFLELFVPSAGVLGVIAGICLLSGVIVGFFHSVQAGIGLLLGIMVLLPIAFTVMVKAWPHTPIGKRILIGPVDRDDIVPQGEYYDELQSLTGRLGTVKTKMLPSGIVIIDGKKFDAVSDGLPLDPGETVKVTAIKGNRIFVSKYEGQAGDASDLPVSDTDLLTKPLEELGLDPIDDPLS